MGKGKGEFWNSVIKNGYTENHYFVRLFELACSRFKYENMPTEIDLRYFELALNIDGRAVLYVDDDLKDDGNEGYVGLRCTIGGNFDIYGIPIRRTALGVNGYHKLLDNKNSVLVYNNFMHTNTVFNLYKYSDILWDIDRSIQVNVRAQKTPIFFQCDEDQKQTVINLYKEYDGNAPVIYGYKNFKAEDAFRVLSPNAPYTADRLYELKERIWNEALTYLGISNISIEKKERLIVDEVERSEGGTVFSRYTWLDARRRGIELFNKKYGQNAKVDFRDEFDKEETKMPEGDVR